MMKANRLVFLLGLAFFVTGLSAQADVALIECEDIQYSKGRDAGDLSDYEDAEVQMSCMKSNGRDSDTAKPDVKVDGDTVAQLLIDIDFRDNRVMSPFRAQTIHGFRAQPMDGRGRVSGNLSSSRRRPAKFKLGVRTFDGRTSAYRVRIAHGSCLVTIHETSDPSRDRCPEGYAELVNTEDIQWQEPRRERSNHSRPTLLLPPPRSSGTLN